MKQVMKYLLLIICIGLLTFCPSHIISAKQGPPHGQATPPSGQGGPPTGQSQNQKAQPQQQGLVVGFAQVNGNLAPQIDSKVQQAWCLEHEGNFNMVLPDKTICNCLTKTHAIAFTSGDTWLESIGKSLHFAFKTGKNPAIVVFTQGEETPAYVLQLDAIVKHFDLPIFIWEEVVKVEKATTP